MELDPEKDLQIDVSNLSTEFREFSLVMYRYSLQRAKSESQRDIAKAKLKETKAMVYKRLKADTSIKYTEKGLESEVDTDPSVIQANIKAIQAEHDAASWAGAVDSMRAKKDMLMQLGADSRKER